jgi:hypothetical protein
MVFREFGVKGLVRLMREEDLRAAAIDAQKQGYSLP